MSIKFLFEDNENSPVSMLLKSCYNGNNIYFSNGCSKLLNKAISIKQDIDDVIVIYYDVAPNNINTVKGYRELCKTIKTKNISNIIVIPIICIEYIVVKYLYKYNEIIIPKNSKEIEEYLIKDIDWNNYINNCKTNNYIKNSIEHFYKYILSQVQPQRCKQNSHKYIKDSNNIDLNYGSGKYYYIDCPCDRYCKIKSTSKIKEKAERLYAELPLITVVDDTHREYIVKLGIKLVNKKSSDIEKDIQTFYDKLCINMGVNRLKIRIYY